MRSNIVNRIWFIWFVLFVTAWLVIGCDSPSENSQESLASAKQYIAKNRPREAVLELKNALQANPDNAEARYLLGELNLDLGDIVGAEKEFNRALQSGWNEGKVQLGLAKAAHNGNNFEKLIDGATIKNSYPVAVQADLHGLQSSAYAALGLLQQADEALAKGTDLDPNALQVRKAKIQLSLLRGDYHLASGQADEALMYYPKNRELLLLNGISRLRGGDKATGVAALQKVIDLEPVNFSTIYGRQARLRLAGMQIADRKLDQAAETLEPLLQHYANDPETNYLGGMLAFSQGEYDLAEERLYRVLKNVPDHSNTQLLFGALSYKKGNLEQADHYLTLYLGRSPDNLGARKLLGRVYILLGQQDKAKEVLASGLREEEDDAELLAMIGLTELSIGNQEDGINNLERAVELAPDNMLLRKEVAKVYLQAGEFEQAITELSVILKQEKGNETEHTQVLLILAQLKAGNQDKAIDYALEMLSKSPSNPAVLTLVGNVFAATGDKAEARKYYIKALQLNPKQPQANASLARLEELEGNLSEAVAIYKAMADEGANSIVPLLALARLAARQSNRDEMYKWLEKARQASPQQLPARTLLAEAFVHDERWNEAEMVIKEARKIAPKNPRVLSLWARFLIASQRYNEAVETLYELVRMAPDFIFAKVLLSQTYLILGQIAEAKKELYEVNKKHPDSVSALSLLVKVEIQSGELKSALEHIRRIQELVPDHPVGYELVGDYNYKLGNYKEALSAYIESWHLRQTSRMAIKLSLTAKKAGRPEKGLEVLENWISKHHDDVKAQETYALILQDVGKNNEAVDVYEKILKFQPENLIALNNLAWLYVDNDLLKALSLAERAYQKDPMNPGIQDTYGWILVKHGELDKGRILINEALEKLSMSPEVRYHQAVVIIKSGDKEKGHDLLRTLLIEEHKFEGRKDAEKLLID